MLTRLRSLKLTLLLAYALVLQGVALATAASARQANHGATGWCISVPLPGAVAGATVPSAPTATHDDTCCMGACASGAFAFPPRAEAASQWPELSSQRPTLVRMTARLRDNPAHPWSPRGPPSV